MKKRSVVIMTSLIVVSAILAVISYLTLPDMVTVQVTLSGEAGNRMPKLLAIAVPFGLSVISALAYGKKSENVKYLLLSLLGMAIYIITWLVN